ncbi:hypothetical protein [Streptomyces sp. NPDC002566]|uniref:hypothetical protein n=1 Tax=Streptomyces sp. NPDC002566 TaxID=3364650 RepID=UPI0036BE34E5
MKEAACWTSWQRRQRRRADLQWSRQRADLWNGFRGRVAEWFGRGDAVRESRELERLDRSASELSTAGQDEVERLV